MAKQKHALQTPPQHSQGTITYQHQRGVIKENAIQALLHDKLFRNALNEIRKAKAAINVKRNTRIVITKSPIIRFL